MIGARRGRAVRMRPYALALAAAAVALAFPAAASAAGTAEGLSTAKVKTNDGFKLSFSVGPNSRHGPVTLEALLQKRSGRGVGSVLQDADYTFDSALTFTEGKKLRSAHASGTFADKHGFIKMTFTATGAATKVPVQKDCRGTPGEKRNGTLRGSFDLKAGKLGTMKLASIRATLLRRPKVKLCYGRARDVRESGGWGRRRDLPVFALYTTPHHRGGPNGVHVEAIKPRGTAPVTEDIEAFDSGHGFSLGYEYAVDAPRADYTFSSNLSSATLKGYGGIKGTAKYTGTPDVRNPGGVRISKGTLSGNLSVDMAAIGNFEPFASGPVRAFQSN